MGIYKEVWVKDIAEYLKKDDSIIAKAIIDDQYVLNNKVYLPNAGAASTITRDRSSFPASATQRTDTAVNYQLHTYDSAPVNIAKQSEGQWLSYDKRMSVMKQNLDKLKNTVSDWVIYEWVAGSNSATTVETTGAARAALGADQTGNRSGLTFADLMNAKRKLDGQDIPSKGRVLLLDSDLAYDITDDSQFQYADALANQITTEGFIGTIAGFEVYMRSSVALTSGDTTSIHLPGVATATDNKVALAYHPDYVRRAIAGEWAYLNENDALYFGDVMSFGANAGAALSRSDKYGVIRIVEAQ